MSENNEITTICSKGVKALMKHNGGKQAVEEIIAAQPHVRRLKGMEKNQTWVIGYSGYSLMGYTGTRADNSNKIYVHNSGRFGSEVANTTIVVGVADDGSMTLTVKDEVE